MKKIKLLSTLTAVGMFGTIVPLVTSCNKSTLSTALSEEDKTFLNDINKIVATLDFEGVPFKAVHAVKNAGFNLFEHKFSNPDFQLVLNMDGVKEYALLHNDVILTPTKNITEFSKNKVWKFVEKYDPTSEYAQHLNDNFKWDGNQTLEVTGPVDTGTNTNVKKIKYIGTNTAKTNYIRTYTEFLTIEPQANDVIHHFHYANNVYIIGTGSSHYLEYGRSCYLRATKTNLSFAQTQARDEPSTVDVFEPIRENTVKIVDQGSDTNVYTKLGTVATTGKTLTTKYNPQTKYAETFTELDAATGSSCIVRLMKDIALETVESLTIGRAESDPINIVLDLNGHSIDTTEVETDTEIIEVRNGTLVLMDSAGPDSKGKITGNQHISVAAAMDDETATFILNGGKIEFTSDDSTQLFTPAITVGNSGSNPQSSTQYRSELYIYGGSIKSFNTSENTDISTPAIEMVNRSAYLYSVYGEVYGTDGAIVTCDHSHDTETEGAEIEIFGGNFTTDDKHICINLRRQAKFVVYGGSFKGGTCIGAINSELDLNGGYFNATGAFVEDFYDDGVLVSDGSVISCYWHKDEEAAIPLNPPRIISNNVKMYSDKGLILHLGSATEATSTEKSWIEFISGCYYWCGDAEKVKTWPAGMQIDSQTTFDKFQWLQKGLWTRR